MEKTISVASRIQRTMDSMKLNSLDDGTGLTLLVIRAYDYSGEETLTNFEPKAAT